jgi:hypothetical protein
MDTREEEDTKCMETKCVETKCIDTDTKCVDTDTKCVDTETETKCGDTDTVKELQLDRLYVNLDSSEEADDDDEEEVAVQPVPERKPSYQEIKDLINNLNNNEMVEEDEIIVSEYFRHLNDVGLNYTDHMFHSLKYSARMALGCITSLIHAFYPDIFIDSTTSTVEYLQNEMASRKRSLEIKKLLRKQLKKIKRS